MMDFPIVASTATTSLGDIPGGLFDRLLQNESGLKPIPAYRFDASYKNALNRNACLIDETADFWRHPQDGLLKAYVLPMIREVLESVEAAGIEVPPDRIGLCIGTSVGTSHELATALRLNQEPAAPTGFSNLLEEISREFGITGPVSIVSTACTAGATSIVRAIHYLRTMQADLVVCGGFDFFSELTHAGFNSLRAMTPTYCRPFSADRDGMILGDGLGFVALVRRDSDEKDVWGLDEKPSIGGFAIGVDNYHETSPEPSGEKLSMLMERAWIQAGRPEISYVNAHGTATEANDATEANALQLFARRANQESFAVSSIKGHIGHTLGAAGAIEAIIAASSLERGIAPGNFGLREPMAAMPSIAFAVKPAPLRPGSSAMSVSMAFGGHIAVLLINPGREH